jgi:hypothetical protein
MLARREKKSVKISDMIEGFYLVISITGINRPNTGGGGEDDNDNDDDDIDNEMNAYVHYMFNLLLLFINSYVCIISGHCISNYCL